MCNGLRRIGVTIPLKSKTAESFLVNCGREIDRHTVVHMIQSLQWAAAITAVHILPKVSNCQLARSLNLRHIHLHVFKSVILNQIMNQHDTLGISGNLSF